MENNPTLNTKTSEQGTTNNNIKNKAQYYSRSNYLNQINYSAVDYRYDEESNDNINLNKLQEPALTEVHRLLEPFSPQPADIENSMSKTDRQPSPSSFDLETIIKKYGDNSELLQLILVSKVEEDRRRAEEAKLKRKELDYLVSDKEPLNSNATRKTCSYGENSIVDDTIEYSKETIILDKGKEKEDDPNTAFNHHYPIPKSTKNEHQLNKENNVKRKIRDDEEQQILFPSQVSNNKDEDYFSSSSASSYFSPGHYDANGVRTKRHSSLNQLFSSSLSAVSPSGSTSSTPVEIPARQLQSLDYLNSRRNSFGPFSPSLYQRSSFTGKYNMVDNIIQPSTLPPISISLQSHDQQQFGMEANSSLISSQQQPPTVTSAPLVHYRCISNNNYSNGRFQNLPTLDSFEASIMETLPFDNKFGHSSSADENGPSAKLESTRLSDDPLYETTSSLKQIRKRSLQYSNNKLMLFKDKKFINNATTTGSSLSIINNEAITSKKLPLPPNPSLNNQGSSDLSTRPRRRRREMQAITMIIETREFPYNDEYVWKNNGNTIHKSSGQKSIYYKCSNSNAGCPVNKTVTFRDNGEYLIKYRGTHLEQCSKIKRIVNVQ